ncbi:MAG TPA: RDD family protein [Thermoanaerobaculia bacterium]|jgi:uncharacterized RDD family membrane protein YckC
MRFDEMELEPVPAIAEPAVVLDVVDVDDDVDDAPRFKRLFALLTDLSLFVALALALLPLLPPARDWFSVAALAGFVVIVSYYYFVGTWLLWGKTIGGAIFDVRVVAEPMTLGRASGRWAAMFLSFATAGIGFLLALLPSRRSLADRLSATHCLRG